MTVYTFEGKTPKVGEGTYISKSAEIIGDVTIGKKCFIGPGAKIKGDYGTIVIGDENSIQENCVLHARPGEVCRIGNRTTIGHGAIIHTCTVKDSAVIGMGAIVSDFAEIGVWGVVGEGCVVKNNQQIPDGNIAVGIPAKIIGTVNEDYKTQWNKYKDIYVGLAKRYRDSLKNAK